MQCIASSRIKQQLSHTPLQQSNHHVPVLWACRGQPMHHRSAGCACKMHTTSCVSLPESVKCCPAYENAALPHDKCGPSCKEQGMQWLTRMETGCTTTAFLRMVSQSICAQKHSQNCTQ